MKLGLEKKLFAPLGTAKGVLKMKEKMHNVSQGIKKHHQDIVYSPLTGRLKSTDCLDKKIQTLLSILFLSLCTEWDCKKDEFKSTKEIFSVLEKVLNMDDHIEC